MLYSVVWRAAQNSEVKMGWEARTRVASGLTLLLGLVVAGVVAASPAPAQGMAANASGAIIWWTHSARELPGWPRNG